MGNTIYIWIIISILIELNENETKYKNIIIQNCISLSILLLFKI